MHMHMHMHMHNIYINVILYVQYIYILCILDVVYTSCILEKKTYSPGEKDQGRLQCDAHGGAHRQTWDVILKGHWDTY